MKNDTPSPFARPYQEPLSWRPVFGARKGYNSGRSFDKPGQEEVAWSTSRVDRSGKHFSDGDRGIRIGKLLTETTYPCGFCRGKGEKPKGTICPVCGGVGKVTVNPPAVVCAYCKGRGEEKPRSNMICTVCRGTGIVHVTEPVEGCVYCRGTGREFGNKLPCLQCRGKGVVTKPGVRKSAL